MNKKSKMEIAQRAIGIVGICLNDGLVCSVGVQKNTLTVNAVGVIVPTSKGEAYIKLRDKLTVYDSSTDDLTP